MALKAHDRSCILVYEGQFYGMGYIPADQVFTDADELKELLTVYRENSFIRNIVHGYAARFPDKVVHFKSNRFTPAIQDHE
jgi:DNA polymerase-3 subunit epsilon